MPRICVVGDVILDQYLYCSNRDNPESSAPCYRVERTEFRPGGAGNVAAQLAALGAQVTLVGVTGDDLYREALQKELRERNITTLLVADAGRPTIVKQRIIGQQDGRYHCRLDHEKNGGLATNHTDEIIQACKGAYDYYIISDYAKGVMSERLVRALVGSGIPVFVDPKPVNLSLYTGVTYIKPNSKEVREMARMSDDVEAARYVARQTHANILLTRGEHGVLHINTQGEEFSIASEARDVVDVTGAGDTVVAVAAYCLASGYPARRAVELANKAAGIAVGHVGCYQVRKEELGL